MIVADELRRAQWRISSAKRRAARKAAGLPCSSGPPTPGRKSGIDRKGGERKRRWRERQKELKAAALAAATKETPL